jgi:hypothetical protein
MSYKLTVILQYQPGIVLSKKNPNTPLTNIPVFSKIVMIPSMASEPVWMAFGLASSHSEIVCFVVHYNLVQIKKICIAMSGSRFEERLKLRRIYKYIESI